MTIRQEIEMSVRAVNSVLHNKIPSMDLVELLRNAHPNYRADWAFRLWKEKKLTKLQASEFTKIV